MSFTTLHFFLFLAMGVLAARIKLFILLYIQY